jgi:hypothetical protein
MEFVGERTNNTADTGGDQVNEWVCGVSVFDEDGSTLDDGVDGL